MAEFSADLKDSVMKGNLTVFKELKHIKIFLQDYLYEDGQWKLVFNVKNLSCRSNVLAVPARAFGIIFDKKTCLVLKGTYVFEVDYNKMDHMLTITREYGRMMRRLEARIRAGTFLCYELETEVVPKK